MTRHGYLAISLALVLGSPMPVLAQAEDYFYSHFKEKIFMRIDEVSIVAYDERGRPSEEIVAELQQAGLAEFEFNMTNRKRLLLTRDEPPTPQNGRLGVAELMRNVTGRPDNTLFLTPLFVLVDPETGVATKRDDNTLILDNRILVRFREEVPFGTAQSILNANTPGQTQVTGWLGDENTFLYKVFTGSAMVLLDAANRLAVDSSWSGRVRVQMEPTPVLQVYRVGSTPPMDLP